MPPLRRASHRRRHAPRRYGPQSTVPGSFDRLLRHLPHRLDQGPRRVGGDPDRHAVMIEASGLTKRQRTTAEPRVETMGLSPMLESQSFLRPVERLVLRLVDEGVGDVEIARRFRRSPEMIRRIIAMARLPGRAGARVVQGDGLRPLERRLLRWRHYGATYTEIGSRFHRSPAFVARVEAFAHYKLEDRPASGGSARSNPPGSDRSPQPGRRPGIMSSPSVHIFGLPPSDASPGSGATPTHQSGQQPTWRQSTP